MNSLKLVRNYFDREAIRFDAIYEHKKPVHQKLVDYLFRRVVVERFHLLCNLIPTTGDWGALDVGCGGGRYGVTLAANGAKRVVGVDVADNMIKLAQAEAEKAKVQDRCEFVTSDFLDWDSTEKFSSVLAMGYYDYLEDPLPHLKKMLDHCEDKVYISFPKRWEFRVPVRKARFAIENGFVRFYSRAEVEAVATQADIPPERMSLIDLGRDWIAVIRV